MYSDDLLAAAGLLVGGARKRKPGRPKKAAKRKAGRPKKAAKRKCKIPKAKPAIKKLVKRLINKL